MCVCLNVTDLAKDYVYGNFQHLPYRNNKIAAQYERSAPEPSPKVFRTINLSTHIWLLLYFFYGFFYIFIILEIPIWVKTSCYAKFYLWAFMWKRHFFIASTNFHCARREKRAANICQDIVWECVCVYVCRYVYE